MPRPSTKLACVTAVVTHLLLLTRTSYAQSSCGSGALLGGSVLLPSGARLTVIQSGYSLLCSPDQPYNVSTDLTLSGVGGGVASIDTEFLTGGVTFTGNGTTLTLQNLRLVNVRFGQGPFLSLLALNVPQLNLSSVRIETDCLTLSSLSTYIGSAPGARGPSYRYVESYVAKGVRATGVNFTCALPDATNTTDGNLVAVADGLELYNVLAMYASNSSAALPRGNGALLIRATANLTILPRLWKRAGSAPLALSRNVTLSGPSQVWANVLDLQAVSNAVALNTGVQFTLANWNLANLGPCRGALIPMGILPLFSIPVWFFLFPRIPAQPQLTVRNCSLVLPPSEYAYFKLWTVLTTTNVSNDLGPQLRASTVAINYCCSTADTITFYQLTGSGLDMVDATLTNSIRGVQYTSLVLDNPAIIESFGSGPTINLTLIPVYDLSDVMSALADQQASPIPMGLALIFLANITIDPATWPADGYILTQPLLLWGQTNVGKVTYLDFQRVPRFVAVAGCLPDEYMYMQGMTPINMPNALQQAGVTAPAGVSDVTIYMSNFQGVGRNCTYGPPALFLNMTTLVVTYTEFRLVHNVVMRSVGISSGGTGTAIGRSFTFEFSSVVTDSIRFVNVTGFGWLGSMVNLTYKAPPGPTLMYNNVYEPLGDPGPPPPDDKNSLRGWQIALIVIGAVLFVALLTSLVAWRVNVRHLQQEVDAVKSGNTDKRSSNASASAEQDATGGRLGSSAQGGGSGNGGNGLGGTGNALVVAGRDSQLGVKGMQNVGTPTGGGGGGGTGGNSDDSAAAQYDKPPLEVLNCMMTALAAEMDDRHLTILEVIGQGGFGVVYRGMWKGLNVAVKTITFQDRVAGGEKAQHRAILEAAISSSLAHPNVVTTYSYDIKPMTVQGVSRSDSPDSGQTGGADGQSGGGGGVGTGGIRILDKRPVLDWKLYLIQEYCDGGSLRTAILKRKFFDTKKGEPRMEMILDTCIELTGGLVHLHERNIIHGDLNPNNVLLKRDASKKYGAVCKIADFGLSIKMNADQSHISNMRRGTPFYTCPQILVRGNMTKAADVYSMGVMMWEMYHCCMSYRSLPTGFAARESFPHFPRKAPHDFARLVGACLEPEPARRPTFLQLRSDLEAQLQAVKRGELRSGEEVLGPDHAGDAAHMAACQD